MNVNFAASLKRSMGPTLGYRVDDYLQCTYGLGVHTISYTIQIDLISENP